MHNKELIIDVLAAYINVGPDKSYENIASKLDHTNLDDNFKQVIKEILTSIHVPMELDENMYDNFDKIHRHVEDVIELVSSDSFESYDKYDPTFYNWRLKPTNWFKNNTILARFKHHMRLLTYSYDKLFFKIEEVKSKETISKRILQELYDVLDDNNDYSESFEYARKPATIKYLIEEKDKQLEELAQELYYLNKEMSEFNCKRTLLCFAKNNISEYLDLTKENMNTFNNSLLRVQTELLEQQKQKEYEHFMLSMYMFKKTSDIL